MRGQLIFVVAGATIAVGALCTAATIAYAGPPPAFTAAAAKSAALVVPANYTPSSFADSSVASPAGLTAVKPGSAVDIGEHAKATSPAVQPVPASAGSPASNTALPANSVPTATPTPAAGSGSTESGDDTSSDGRSDDGQGSGSNKGKSNKGNDVNNKGDGSNKGKGHSGG